MFICVELTSLTLDLLQYLVISGVNILTQTFKNDQKAIFILPVVSIGDSDLFWVIVHLIIWICWKDKVTKIQKSNLVIAVTVIHGFDELIAEFYPWAVYGEGPGTFNSHVTAQDGPIHGGCHIFNCQCNQMQNCEGGCCKTIYETLP